MFAQLSSAFHLTRIGGPLITWKLLLSSESSYVYFCIISEYKRELKFEGLFSQLAL